jgi:hypothetical protein
MAALSSTGLFFSACADSRADIPSVPVAADDSAEGTDGAGRSRNALATWQSIIDEVAGAAVPVRDRAAAVRALLEPAAARPAPGSDSGHAGPGGNDGLQVAVDLVACGPGAVPYWAQGPCGASTEFLQITMKFGGSTVEPGACPTNADLRDALLKKGWSAPPVSKPPAVTVDDGVVRLTRDSGMTLEDVFQSSPSLFARIRPSANMPPRCHFEFSLIALQL